MSCLDCKWADFDYIPPRWGEGEPDLEFECLNPNVKAFDFDEESELEEIAENCEHFEDNLDERIVSEVCKFATNHEGIISTGQRVKQEYEVGDYTENSLKMAFGMIAQSAINEYANKFMDSEWCTEALDDKEFMGKISAKLREHFLGGENGQTAAI
jgi:hypothetical protein